ncbi:MAG: hypothetical protein CMI90_05910 [Pelagibacteraceae bacterium]|nr:hypothetical protein [Pelagibacteraceae bacterium]
MKVSLIIPVKDDFEMFCKTYNAVMTQNVLPEEIIIIDSSKNDNIKKYINNIKTNIDTKYFHFTNKYPGEARNIGIKKTKYDIIAFLDSKTIPNEFWIEKYKNLIINENYDIVYGTTKYFYNTNTQKKIRAATFGNNFHVTTPGTFIKKSIVLKDNYFIEKVRTADDLEWRIRLNRKKYKIYNPKNYFLKYESLPNNLFGLLKRYFIYSFHTAQVNVDNKIKFLYFLFFSLLVLLIIPKWNQYIPGWNSSHPLYIENQIKILLLLFITSFIVIFVINNFNFKLKYFNNFLKFSLIIISILFIYNWNFLIAGWLERSIFYLPHITKIYISSLLVTSFFIRGIVYPLKRNISKKYLFPFNWLSIGLYGFAIDLIKTPGYLFGAILPKYFKKFSTDYTKKIVFYPKYGSQSPSYRVRFLSYKKFLENKGYNVETQILFDENFYKNRIFKNKLNLFKVTLFYYIRLKDILTRKKPFIAISHIEFLPFVPIIAELILRLRKIPYMIDIDDAVYLRYYKKNKFLYSYDIFKFNYTFKKASNIFVGNKFHLNKLNKYNRNINYIPTVIDFKKYNKYLNKNKFKKFTLVWIGTPSTTKYLLELIPLLNDLVNNNKIKVLLIGADLKQVKNLNCEFLEWKEETELDILSKCHLGIMPLHDTSWELGKCAYKILQYMALKLPVVASPIGTNKEIIKDAKNGFLASDLNEWNRKIQLLINDKDIREAISTNGFNTVMNDFNLEKYQQQFFNLIEELK